MNVDRDFAQGPPGAARARADGGGTRAGGARAGFASPAARRRAARG